MSVIIRLQNLPWSANSLDIRQYFQGLSIPEGGVHIVGGELGDAFIAFSTDEDARQAMLIDGGKIKEVKIKLYLSSRTEMQKVIETARTQTLNLQSFMQMSAPPIIPQIPMQQGPVLPILNQMPTKVITPEIKTPAQQPSVLQQPPMLPQPGYPQTANATIAENKNIPNQNSEMEVNDLDSETMFNKDKRDRRDHQKSRSVSRDKSRDRSRDRSKSRDRRDFRSRDRYRDRRRRDRSRSRDRRRRNRDRSRSKERSSRNSRERRKDYDKNSATEGDKNKNKKSPSVEENVAPQIPLTVAQKPGFTSSNWITVNDKSNLLAKSQTPLTKPPIPPMLPQLPKPVQEKNELNSNLSVDHDGRSPLMSDMFLASNKLPAQMPENLMISRQTPLLQRPGIYPSPIMGLENKNDSPKHNLPQENWPRPLDVNRPPLIDNERMMSFNPYSNPGLDMERRNAAASNNTFRADDSLNRVNYLSQSNNEQFQSMFQNKPDLRMNNFNASMERSNYGAEELPVERDSYRSGSLIDRQNFRQNSSPVDKGNYRPDSQPLERAGYRQEPLSDRGNYRHELNERAVQKQEPIVERGNQRQEMPIERGNYRQNPPMERGGYRPESFERNNQRPDRPFLNNDRFSPMERPDRPSPYSQRQFNQRGKYNNSCIEVRNMSPSTTYSDLRRFFHGLFIPGDGIKIINDCQGNRIGIAYIRFAKPYCKEQALKKNGNYIKNTMVEVLHINDDLFDKAVDAPVSDGRNHSQDNRGNYNTAREQEISHDDFIALAIREFPPYTKEKDIQNIFRAWKLADCFLLPKSGRRNASAYVKFFNMDDARKALAATSRYIIGNRKINVSICYEHEFQDARDIKNMEEDEDDRLVIDTKDEPSTKTNELWSPPKDPRAESKVKTTKTTEQKKEVEPELNKTEFQHLETQHPKEVPQSEPKISESKISEPVQLEPKQPELERPESFTQGSSQFVVTQPDDSEQQELNVNITGIEQTQTNDHLPNPVAVDTSEKKSNSDPVQPILQRPLLATPLIKNPLIMPSRGISMNAAEFENTNRNATDCIILRGLPYQANDRDIINFFADEDVIPTQIHIMLDKAGHPAGDAFCEFASIEEVEFALQKDNMPLGRSMISVLPVSREEMCEALGMAPSPERQLPPSSFPPRPLPPLGRGGMRGRYRPNFHPPPYHYEQRLPPLMGYDHRRNVMPKHRREEEFERGPSVDAFGRPGCVVALENVPFKADVDEIIDFFRGFGVTRENVIRRYNELGHPTGDARVSLSSPQEAQRAIKVLSHKQIRHRPIFMHLLS